MTRETRQAIETLRRVQAVTPAQWLAAKSVEEVVKREAEIAASMATMAPMFRALSK